MTKLMVADGMYPCSFTYTNWKGRKSFREVTPLHIYWGKTEYHPENQWLMKAFDHKKQAYRDFALKDMTIETD